MPDYKKMYFKLYRATEKAISDLVAVQMACEEMYIEAVDTPLEFLPPADDKPPK